jgi:hypothetical protein
MFAGHEAHWTVILPAPKCPVTDHYAAQSDPQDAVDHPNCTVELPQHLLWASSCSTYLSSHATQASQKCEGASQHHPALQFGHGFYRAIGCAQQCYDLSPACVILGSGELLYSAIIGFQGSHLL